MNDERSLPHVLIIDDVLGRQCPNGTNNNRVDFCASFLLRDVTGDGQVGALAIAEPTAAAYFHRGQRPVKALRGDTVENDLDGILKTIESRWSNRASGVPPWSLVLLDLCFYTGQVTAESENKRNPGMPEGCKADENPASYFGLKVLEEMHKRFPALPVAILSARPREPAADRFSQLGAVDFLAWDEKNAVQRLREVITHHALLPDDDGALVGYSIPLLVALREARRAASGSQSVLIVGEPGTGKELVARYIHRHRKLLRNQDKRPFIPVNSSALTSELYASELFGHAKGSFTGAVSARAGAIRAAQRGDLFLDEVGDMPDYVQKGLLRAIEYGEVQPLGRDGPVSIEDVSFLFATNRDLDALYREGKFRGDLLDRIRSGKTIHLPPLRDRREDFPLLVEALLRKAEEEFNAKKRSVLEEAMDALKDHSWPGNVRELDSCIRRAVADYPRIDRLAAIHLRIHVAQSIPTHPTRFDDLVQELERLGGDSLSPEDLKGALAKLENAYAMASARLIKAGLDCTRNSTGEIQITPAMRLVMNQGDLTTAQAADLIKRFLRPLDASRLPDETLERARQAANRLRTPKKSKGVPDTSASPASHAVPPPGSGKMS